MKKLLLLTLLCMLALPSWAADYEGNVLWASSSMGTPSSKGPVKATIVNNTLSIWSPPDGIEVIYDNNFSIGKFFTESRPMTFTLSADGATATLNQDKTGNGYYGNVVADIKTEGNKKTLTINSGTIQIKGTYNGIGFSQYLQQFQVNLTEQSTDPTVKLQSMTYDYAKSFTATLSTANIPATSLYGITVKAGLAANALTSVANVTVNGTFLNVEFDLDLASVNAGKEFKVYLQAEYGTTKFDLVSEEEFTKPNGNMTYGLVNYPNGISAGEISYQPGTEKSNNVIGIYTPPTSTEGAGRLIITNFAGIIPTSLTFYVYLDGAKKGTVSLEKTAQYGNGYLYKITPLTTNLTGKIVNTSTNTSKLTISPWGTANIEGTKFNSAYFDTEIEFDFAIDGLLTNPADITVRDASVINIASSTADLKYNLKTDNIPDGTTYTLIATLEEYIEPEVGGDDDDDDYGYFSVAARAAGDADGEEGNNNTFTFPDLTATEGSVKLKGLTPQTHYTATVIAQAVSEGKVIAESDVFKMRNFTTTDVNPKITLGEATVAPDFTSAKITVPVTLLDCGETVPESFALKYYTGSDADNATVATATNDGNGNYTFTISDLAEGRQYSYNIIGTATVNGTGVTSNVVEVSFKTKAITITLGTATATAEATSATVTVPVSYENFPATPSFTFKYYEGNNAASATPVDATADGNGNYTLTISGLNINTAYIYRIVAEATASGKTVTSNAVSVSFRTKNPAITLGTATATAEITSATVTVPVSLANFGDVPALSFKYYEGNNASAATAVNAAADGNGNYTLTISGLNANTDYSYSIVAEATVGGTTLTSNAASVSFKTKNPTIALGTVTAKAANTSAAITVPVTFTDCGDSAPALTLKYYAGSDSSKAVEATGVTKDGNNYTFTISGLAEATEYTYSIYAEATVAGAAVTSNTAAVSFTTTGDSGVEEVAADEDARYFTLQGVEISNPEAGTLCIKVSGNKATKVIIR